ncbi:hypothetical protein TNCV_3732521 [Trichonephila clavipes]|nr:hypothetical protein TNCV_3732521 [Trichonephila clavipes]
MCTSEMDITPRKRSEIIAFNKHISMTVRDIATVFVVWANQVFQEFQVLIKILDHHLKKEKENVGSNGKLL